jgi:hypothetical protein
MTKAEACLWKYVFASRKDERFSIQTSTGR